MSDERRGRVVGAIILIFIGLFFIADKLDIFEFTWPLILVGIGVALLIQTIVDKRHQPLQGGVLLLLLGLIFLADENNWLRWGLEREWPLIFFAIGISFIVSFWAKPERRGHLTSGIVLLVFGSLFLGAEHHYFRWRDVGDILSWWPLLLLGLGVYLLMKDRKRVPPSDG